MNAREIRDLRVGVEDRIAALREAGAPITMSVLGGAAIIDGQHYSFDSSIPGDRSRAITTGLDDLKKGRT